MGKKQHSKDQLYLTRTEHASGEHRGTGKLSTLHLPYRTLPFDCCAVSFRPFETPLCTADGIVFELLNIVPYLKKYHRHPVTGGPLQASDLVKLHFHKNAEGQYACPVLYKPFTQHTHIVAIRPTGNVYCYQAVKDMNLKRGHLHDLLDETPFKREDVIHIQDPSDGGRREMERFNHVVENLQVDLKNTSGVRHNEATARIMEKVGKSAAAATSAAAGSSSSAGAASGKAKAVASTGGGGVPAARWAQTTGACAQSLTSTSVPVQTVNEIAALSEEEEARQRYAFVRAQKTKGYAQLQTSHGTINLELHAEIAPQTCENFILLLERGYYNGTPVHRLIKNFMVQMGDPSGTGSGGESAWGKPFKDEISNKLHHEGGGVLSMANSGPGTNGSQFFITFKSAVHLDGKHTIFGKVVGGLDTLAKLERLSTDKEDRPTEPVTLLGGSVFVNPYADLEAKMEAAHAKASNPAAAAAEEKAKTAAQDSEAWFNNSVTLPTAHRPGIGKYIAPHHVKADVPAAGASASAAAPADGSARAAAAAPAAPAASAVSAALASSAALAAAAAAPEPPKKKPKSGGFGSFSGW